MKSLSLLLSLAFVAPVSLNADAIRQTKVNHYDAFRQLDVDLPTPNVYRTASGAPGSQYWQQRADYISRKWTKPARNGAAALNRFTIEFGDRITENNK